MPSYDFGFHYDSAQNNLIASYVPPSRLIAVDPASAPRLVKETPAWLNQQFLPVPLISSLVACPRWAYPRWAYPNSAFLDSSNSQIGDTHCLKLAVDRHTVRYTVHTFGKRSAGTQRYSPLTSPKTRRAGLGQRPEFTRLWQVTSE